MYDAGIPVPAPGDVIEVEGRQGILFERVEGRSMLRDVVAKPWAISRHARALARLHLAIHSYELSDLPPLREQLDRMIQAAGGLTPPERQIAAEQLGELPEGDVVCHGDFHPDNVILSARGPIIIDWMTATRGHPSADVAITALLLELADPPPGTRGRWLIQLLRARFRRAYLSRYGRGNGEIHRQVEAWRLPLSVARLSEGIPEEQAKLLEVVQASLAKAEGD